jgi:type VI secretion system protein
MPLTLEVVGQKAAQMGSAVRKVFQTGGTIGRLRDNDWVLPDEYISGRHAKITFSNGSYLLDDTSTNGVFVNSPQNRMTKGKPYALRDGDTIYIDDYEVRVTLAAESAAVPGYSSRDSYGAPGSSPGGRAPLIPDDPMFEDAIGSSAAPNDTDPLALLGIQDAHPLPSGPSAASLASNSPMSDHYRPPTAPPPPPPPPPRPQRAAPPPPSGGSVIPDDYDPFAPDDAPAPRAGPRPAPPSAPAPAPPPRSMAPSRPAPETATPAYRPAPLPETPAPRARPAAPPETTILPPPRPEAPAEAVMPPPRPAPARPPAPPRTPAPPPGMQVPSAAPPQRVPPAAAAAPRTPAPSDPPAPPATQAPSWAQPIEAGSRRASSGGSDLDFATMLAAAGVDSSRITPELATQFGQILRVVVSGLMDVLRARERIKDEFRMRMTTFKQADNNPLKFSANVDDALHNLLVKRNAAYLGPVEAFEDAFQDLRNHQMAMLAGMRVAYESMLAEFDPQRLQEDFDRQVKGGSFLSGPAKLKYWELYRNRFHDMVKDADTSFRNLFGDEFAKAYEEQLAKLKTLGRAERR